MNNDLKTTIDQEGSVVIINLSGEVTTFSESEISKAYQSALTKGASNVVLDFDKVNYINSAGIAILIGLVADTKNKGVVLSICGLNPHFQKIFKMVGFSQYTEIFENREAALAALSVSG